MKKLVLVLTLSCVSLVKAQDFNDLFISGLEDAERFANSYLAPVQEAGIYSISNGWYNTADAKPLGGFEISIIGNITGFNNKNDKKAFVLDPSEYENLDFVDNPGTGQGGFHGLGRYRERYCVCSGRNGLGKGRIRIALRIGRRRL